MARTRPEPGPLFSSSRRPSGPFSRRDRDWQIVVVVVTLVAMFVFEMFHSPPCDLDWDSCSGSRFAAQIAVNALWAMMMGIATGIALAAIMGLLVDSIDDRRSKGTTAPLVRIALALSAIVVVFVVVFVRFDLVAS
jgi:NhaP-type Na+/H+ or K+/H+ antiporter